MTVREHSRPQSPRSCQNRRALGTRMVKVQICISRPKGVILVRYYSYYSRSSGLKNNNKGFICITKEKATILNNILHTLLSETSWARAFFVLLHHLCMHITTSAQYIYRNLNSLDRLATPTGLALVRFLRKTCSCTLFQKDGSLLAVDNLYADFGQCWLVANLLVHSMHLSTVNEDQ